MKGLSFETRARTIDHLGRGQIADSPTAISELWKNAYDAYARGVSLHIFDGAHPVACIFDDGKGMSIDDVRQKWLVLGTESKTGDDPEDDDFRLGAGLPERVKQGEKGIGRLSVAFLAPATALITKKPNGNFVVVLVDWRLFENPFLSLSDIRLPVQEFESAEHIIPSLAAMAEVVLENLGEWEPTDDHSPAERERKSFLKAAWDRFADQEKRLGLTTSTREAILYTWNRGPVSDRLLEEWPVYLGLAQHGTALILIEVQHDLAVWVEPTVDERADELIKERLRKTLTAFTDPFLPTNAGEDRLNFSYEVILKIGKQSRRVLSTNDIFGPDNFHTLEHYVEGSFDEFGVFEGEVVAFGRSFGRQQIIPERSLTKSDRNQIGPFYFAVGTYEQELRSSTHKEEVYAVLDDAASKYAGISLYRDGLRVMPYGRPDADFFGLEERRSKHAGRNYWAHRRTFGRIAFSRKNNPNLKDKAGREGLVDNRAKALLRILVINVLTTTADTYFGTDSKLRQEEVPRLQAQHKARQEAAKRLAKRRRTNVSKFLRDERANLENAIKKISVASGNVRAALEGGDEVLAAVAANDYREALTLRERLRPPPIPTGATHLEDEYRSYRDGYREMLAGLEELGKLNNQAEARIGSSSPEDVIRSVFHRNQSILASKIDGYVQAIAKRLAELREQIDTQSTEDRRRYWKAASHLLEVNPTADGLRDVLNSLDAIRVNIEDLIVDHYEPWMRSFNLLSDGLDLEGAAISLSDDMAQLEEKVRDLHAVAQAGISVEIIGHELESLDGEIRRNLARLPTDVKQSAPYRLAYEAHSALTEKLRFLSPLKIAGYRNRDAIRGSEIADYAHDFFERSLAANRIEFVATKAFRSIIFSDLRSRIYPVFINLLNNALFWVTRSDERRITLDYIDGKVVVADTGPGVDPDDVERLFSLFYTRRTEGRGVGLYLCRVNLAVGGHEIRYAEDSDPKVHSGANFIIVLRGVVTDEPD